MRRPERVAELVRAEIVQIVGYELADPRVLGVTVTDVRMADNLRDAKIYVTVAGDDAETREAMEALNHAAPYVRRQLGLALDLRHAPVLHFIRDKVEEKAVRVDLLIADIRHPETGATDSPDTAQDFSVDTSSALSADTDYHPKET